MAQAEAQKAAATGELSKDQERGMTAEQKEQFEEAAKKQSEPMKKNKALNDAFNAGQDAMKTCRC